jgi:hypothetical protein
MMRAFRGAVSRLTRRLFFGQWAGNFVLMLLAAGWLQIPDSHTWQFAFSMLSGLLLVLGFLWLYTATFRHLRPCATRPAWWLSWLLVAIFIALYWLLLRVCLPVIGIRSRRPGCALISAIRSLWPGKNTSMTVANGSPQVCCCPWRSRPRHVVLRKVGWAVAPGFMTIGFIGCACWLAASALPH